MEKKLKQLTDRIHYLPHDPETDRPILSAICGTHQTLIIDTGNSAKHAKLFLNELDRCQIKNHHAVVLTHWHWDHSFGANEMNKFTIAHEHTKTHLEKMVEYDWTDEALADRVEKGLENSFCSEMIKKEFGADRDITIALPNITFKDKLEIDLGGIQCVVKHVGGDHSDDSSLIFAKEEKVLFLGDCLYPSIYTQQPQYKVDNVRHLLENIEMFDADVYVLSHEPLLAKEDFKGYINLLKLICNLTEKHERNHLNLVNELSAQLNRKLSQLEEEVVYCFMNGL
ncbi:MULTISPECIES: MBL fold metallo-hydrolase [Clostridia]|uniref:MBL fold metallo-hydrolase n=1 Tax=Clostridia TaxID=186801 RepID=UPI000EA323DA|nr:MULTISPECIES: MBL fold metallo-hydrolase [Clostridia]NBJ69953.1 MBL fold metallo-hydrolase [Roseburia sp. 1XD42-34]RKI77524.1 MBL fold metallo-hydrolase [Clostridium sp. 1xD42-85]